MSLSFSVDDLKKGAENLKKQETRGGGFRETFKFENKESFLLFLAKNNEFIKKVTVHQLWSGGKPVATVGSPKAFGDEDIIMNRGWEVREAILNHPDENIRENEKLKKIFTNYMPKDSDYGQVIDLKDTAKGVQVVKMPQLVKNALIAQVEEIENEEDAEKIFDLDKGSPMKITHNGIKGRDREYEVAKFMVGKSVGLVKKEKITRETVEGQLIDLDKLQPVPTEEKLKQYLAKVEERVKFLVKEEGFDFDTIMSGGMGSDDTSSGDEFGDDTPFSADDFEIE